VSGITKAEDYKALPRDSNMDAAMPLSHPQEGLVIGFLKLFVDRGYEMIGACISAK